MLGCREAFGKGDELHCCQAYIHPKFDAWKCSNHDDPVCARTPKSGSITASEINETYCLSFAMPKCILHLGTLSPSDRYARENNAGESVPYVPGAED